MNDSADTYILIDSDDTLILIDDEEEANYYYDARRPAPRRIATTLVECAATDPCYTNASYASWPHNLPTPLDRNAFVNWMFRDIYEETIRSLRR